jgi:hypothetical protein
MNGRPGIRFRSGGEVVFVESGPERLVRLVIDACGLDAPDRLPKLTHPGGTPPTVRLRLQDAAQPFPRHGLAPVARGAWSDGQRTLLHDVGGSGFDLLVVAGTELDVLARYRPRPVTRALNRALPRRFRRLAGQVLVHYPVLWRAGWRGRVPLHASVIRGPAGTPLLAGPGGVGKSRVVLGALAERGLIAADNLCVADGTRCFGLAEPLRVDAAGMRGRRTSHGRVELPLTAAAPSLEPDRLVMLERGEWSLIEDAKPAEAARTLVAGTYAAGDLRRYWGFAATLALATGRGPAHPTVAEVAQAHAERLPCRRVRVGEGDWVTLADLCRDTLSLRGDRGHG